jgi:hypothetical protein
MPGLGPAAEALLFWKNDPKPFTPSSAPQNCGDVIYGVVDQLATFKQGPPDFLSVSPFGRAEGVSTGN